MAEAEEEVLDRVYGLVAACRRDLHRLEKSQNETRELYEAALAQAAQLEAAAPGAHPLLQEKIKRLLARLRKSPLAHGPGGYGSLEFILMDIEQSPVWEFEAASGSGVARTNREDLELRPGIIDRNRIVSYTLGRRACAVRGVLLYNVRNADPDRSYRVRRDTDSLTVFPYQSERRGAEHLMVFESGEGHLALRYTAIVAIETFDRVRHEKAVEELRFEHPYVAGRLQRGARNYLLIRLKSAIRIDPESESGSR